MKQTSELRVFNFMDILLYNLSESFRQRVILRTGPQWLIGREGIEPSLAASST